jgi:hypothetical protein
LAADSPVVGKWNCVSKSSEDNAPTLETVLTITEQNGTLSGKLQGPDFELPIYEPKVDGEKFTFTIKINEQPYVIDTKLNGKTFEGKFSGPEANGVIRGTKQS